MRRCQGRLEQTPLDRPSAASLPVVAVLQAKYPNDKEFLKAAAEEAGLPRESASAVIEDPRAYADQVPTSPIHFPNRTHKGLINYTVLY
jgi:hypothetical protein